MKKHVSTFFLILLLVAGIGFLLYPSVSDYWNSFHQAQAVAGFEKEVEQTDESELNNLWQEAEEYNRELVTKLDRWHLTKEEYRAYKQLLSVSDTGIMGTVEIPKIKVSLPIYHGIEENVLEVAVGHIAGSSLPVGGESTHAVLSGHRGLPSAKLLTNLDKMEEGDRFVLQILNRKMTYEVDQIRIVEPEDTDDLRIEEGMDYCTLVTCTPYGVNSHRLLVRGHRVENEAEAIRVTSDAVRIDPLIVAAVLAVILLLLLFIWLMIRTSGKKRGRSGV